MDDLGCLLNHIDFIFLKVDICLKSNSTQYDFIENCAPTNSAASDQLSKNGQVSLIPHLFWTNMFLERGLQLLDKNHTFLNIKNIA